MDGLHRVTSINYYRITMSFFGLAKSCMCPSRMPAVLLMKTIWTEIR
jgi:hypothetical protein